MNLYKYSLAMMQECNSLFFLISLTASFLSLKYTLARRQKNCDFLSMNFFSLFPSTVEMVLCTKKIE